MYLYMRLASPDKLYDGHGVASEAATLQSPRPRSPHSPLRTLHSALRGRDARPRPPRARKLALWRKETFTVLRIFCDRSHFYHFMPKTANFYPTPTLSSRDGSSRPLLSGVPVRSAVHSIGYGFHDGFRFAVGANCDCSPSSRTRDLRRGRGLAGVSAFFNLSVFGVFVLQLRIVLTIVP